MESLKKLREMLAEHALALILLGALALVYVLHLFQQLLPINEVEEIALIILLITAILWVLETVPLYVASFGVLLFSLLWLMPAMEASGMDTDKNVFFQAFFGDITLLFMGGFVLSALLNKYGLANMLAQWMLRRTGNRPANVLLGIIIISSVLSMWMSNTATAAMMFAIITPVIMKIPDTSSFSKALSIGIPFACNLGGLGTPIGTPPNAIAMAYLEQVGMGVSFIKWMLIATPMMLLLLFILWRMLLLIFPAGDIKVEIDFEENGDLSPKQKVVIGIFLLTVLGWLTGGMTGLSSGTVGLIVVIVSFGLKLLSTRDFRNISWDILFMLGGGLCLGAALAASGLTTTIAGMVPIESSFWTAFLVMMVLATVMTTFMSNTATANLLIPIAVSLPQNQLLLAVAISIMCSCAMAMPVSTPPNAIAFGSGLLKTKDLLPAGGLVTILAFILTVIASLYYFPIYM